MRAGGARNKIEAVVIGTSAGGVEALLTLLKGLTGLELPSLIVVIHQPADASGVAVELFRDLTLLPVKEAEDKAPVDAGTLYFAPAGYHLLIEKSRTFSLSTEAPVNYSRPSIDVTFESAADAYGKNLAGIVLTGANNDGAAGLKAIQECGGVTIVQDPFTAKFPQMPEAALGLLKPDFLLPLFKIKDFLLGCGR